MRTQLFLMNLFGIQLTVITVQAQNRSVTFDKNQANDNQLEHGINLAKGLKTK